MLGRGLAVLGFASDLKEAGRGLQPEIRCQASIPYPFIMVRIL